MPRGFSDARFKTPRTSPVAHTGMHMREPALVSLCRRSQSRRRKPLHASALMVARAERAAETYGAESHDM